MDFPRDYNVAVDLVGRNRKAGRGAKAAFIDDAGSCTYAQLAERVDRAANALRALKIEREQRAQLATIALVPRVGAKPIVPFGALLAAGGLVWLTGLDLDSTYAAHVLPPLLIMGSALGVVEAHVLPAYGAGLWPLVSMAAILAGTMRAPLTALVFAIELTGRFGVALPILTGAIVAHTFTVLVLKRSILT